MKSISVQALAELTTHARATPRLRKNLNMHERLEDPIQRLCNALEPGTYIRPHCHPDIVWECFVLLSGACTILIFDQEGVVRDRLELSRETTPVAEIPAGAWHSVITSTPGTVIFEVKPGPYLPGTFASWAPEEGSDGARQCVNWLLNAQTGQRFTHD